jgi:Spy/CpxP family protein refolding chaperone
MKHTLLVLALGLGVGLGAHFTYYRLHQPAPTDTLDGELAWMRTELQLTDAQFARIKEIHQASGPHLRAIAAQLAGLQAEFRAFEHSRFTSDKVDFLEFARYVELRRNVSNESQDSTHRLVLAATEVMTPEQRQRYIRLVAAVEPPGSPLLN